MVEYINRMFLIIVALSLPFDKVDQDISRTFVSYAQKFRYISGQLSYMKSKLKFNSKRHRLSDLALEYGKFQRVINVLIMVKMDEWKELNWHRNELRL